MINIKESEMLLKKVDLLGYPLATEAQNPSFHMENISVLNICVFETATIYINK